MHPDVPVNRICVYPGVALDTNRWTGKCITPIDVYIYIYIIQETSPATTAYYTDYDDDDDDDDDDDLHRHRCHSHLHRHTCQTWWLRKGLVYISVKICRRKYTLHSNSYNIPINLYTFTFSRTVINVGVICFFLLFELISPTLSIDITRTT